MHLTWNRHYIVRAWHLVTLVFCVNRITLLVTLKIELLM